MERYEKLEMEVISFEAEDVIATSSETQGSWGDITGNGGNGTPVP